MDFWDDFAAAGEARQAKKVEPERKDFWDDFAEAGEKLQSKKAEGKSSVGTAAMSKRKPAGKGDEWGEW